MSTTDSGARLLFRVDPLPGESPRGYLVRVAQEHSYCGPLSLAEIVGVPTSGLEREEDAGRISSTLRLDPSEWCGMSYWHVKGRNRFRKRSFLGKEISSDDLNYRRPRICPACLQERPVWWAVWDLGLVTACPTHRCILVNQCPACERSLAWQRPAVHRCRCGLDLRSLKAKPAPHDLVAINAAIYQAAGNPVGQAAELDLAGCSFPAEMFALRLGSLLRLLLFMGSIKDKNGLRRKQRPFRATDLILACEIDHAAVAALRDWPQPLSQTLQYMLPPETDNPATLNFNAIFGNFYRHLFHVLSRSEFGFLHDVFERFVIDEWKGLIRGQHRHFSAAVRKNAHWITANQAERIACIAGSRILELVRDGQLESISWKIRRGGSRKEYWIRRASLNRWIANRDAELARYMPRPEAKRELGLTNGTIVRMAVAGVMHYVKGPEQNFPTGCFFFLREDVVRIKRAFEAHAVPAIEYSRPGELIALRHAMKNYLGHGSGLAAIIRAVVDGRLVPAGYSKRFRGITGYLFRAVDLREYRPLSGSKMPQEGVVNYAEAAAKLGVKVREIRGLVEKGILHSAGEYRIGLSKLLPATEVQQFAARFVAISFLARRFHLSTVSLSRYLRESGTALLEVPLPDRGRGYAFFLQKNVAAQVKIPSRSMLREHSQRRIASARRRKWAEYRQGRELEMGKPMRRTPRHRAKRLRVSRPSIRKTS